MGTATTPTGLEYPLHHGETFHTPMGTATAVGETLRARHEKHFISLWGQQLVALCMSTNRSRNISYPYGDSNHREIVHVNVIPETFHTPMGTATTGFNHAPTAPGNISYPSGDSNTRNRLENTSTSWNISYPYGDSNFQHVCDRLISPSGNISYPYGDSNL